jgi:hypothetical protein
MVSHVLLCAVYWVQTGWSAMFSCVVSHVLLCAVYWVQIGWSAMFSCVWCTGYRLGGQPFCFECSVLGAYVFLASKYVHMYFFLSPYLMYGVKPMLIVHTYIHIYVYIHTYICMYIRTSTMHFWLALEGTYVHVYSQSCYTVSWM